MASQITLRPPTASPLSNKSTAESAGPSPPSLDFLKAKWHVTHSTLPMWKKNRNVTITYTVKGEESAGPCKIDDLVEYQPLGKPKQKVVNGIDSPDTSGPGAGWAWNWRGKGWLKIASSRWEVLGYGHEGGEEEGNRWVVTYFAKTLFTPAGLDIYSADKGGLRPGTVEGIKAALNNFEDENLRKLAGSIFEITMDDGQ